MKTRMNHTSRIVLSLVIVCLAVFAQQAISRAADVKYVYQQALNMDAFWNFNGTTPFADKTGNGNDFTSAGAGLDPSLSTVATASGNGWLPSELTSTSIAGEVARVAVFDGNDRLNLPGGLYSGGDFSIFMAGGHMRDAFATMVGADTFRWQKQSSELHAFQPTAAAGGGQLSGSILPSISNWYAFAVTYDSTTDRVNGYLLTNAGSFSGTDLTGIKDLNGAGQTNFVFGLDTLSGIGGADPWEGEMDFIAFDNSVLTSAQLQGLVDDFILGPTLVPEPSTATLLLVGGLVCGVAGCRRRRRRLGQAVQQTA